VLFADLAATSAAVAAVPARRSKIDLLAGCLRRLAAAAPGDIAAGAAYLSGEPRQRQTGVGWASLRDLPPPAGAPTLTVGAVDAALQAMADTSGPGSQGRRRALVHDLFAAATADEQWMLRGLFSGELRQGDEVIHLTEMELGPTDFDFVGYFRFLRAHGYVDFFRE